VVSKISLSQLTSNPSVCFCKTLLQQDTLFIRKHNIKVHVVSVGQFYTKPRGFLLSIKPQVPYKTTSKFLPSRKFNCFSLFADDINFNGNKMKYLEQYAFDDITGDVMSMTGVLAKTLGPCTFRDISLRHWQMQDGDMDVISMGVSNLQ